MNVAVYVECVLEDVDGRRIRMGRVVKQREMFFGDAAT